MSETIQIPKGWKIVKFEDVGDKKHPYPIGDGDHGQIKPGDYSNEGIPYIRVADIVDDQIVKNKLTYIPNSVHDQNKKSHLFPGDILIAKTGATIGKVAIIPDWCKQANTTSSVGKISVDEKQIMSKFLYYFIKSNNFKKQMWAVSEKTAQPGFGIIDLKKFVLPLPPLPIQKKILQKLDDILGQLEEKKKVVFSIIEQNKKKIEFFEENWITYIISNLIPRKELPDGWSLVALSEICDVKRGRFGHRPRNDPDYYGGKYPFIQTGNVANANGRVKTYSQTLNEKGLKTSKMFPKGTVIITIAANIGDTAILEFDSCFPDSLIGITPIPGKAIPEYIEYALRLYQKELTRDASTGAQKNINYKFLKPLLIPIPKTIDMQKKIVQNIKSVEEKFQSQKTQFENLKQNYENNIKYINHIQYSILDAAFSGKLVQ